MDTSDGRVVTAEHAMWLAREKVAANKRKVEKREAEWIRKELKAAQAARAMSTEIERLKRKQEQQFASTFGETVHAYISRIRNMKERKVIAKILSQCRRK